jgi:hypothetical protein
MLARQAFLQPFCVSGIFEIKSYFFPRMASNLDPLNLCLPSS